MAKLDDCLASFDSLQKRFDAYIERNDADDNLESMSNDELIALRQKMLASEPGSSKARKAQRIREILDKRRAGERKDADDKPPKGTKVEILDRGGDWIVRKKDGPGAYISRHNTHSEAQTEANRNRWEIVKDEGLK